MTQPLGFDLNGLWDFAAEGDEDAGAVLKDLGVHSSFVRLETIGREHWIGGVQASLAPHGRGPGWGQIGASENRVFLSDILDAVSKGDVSSTDAGALQGFLGELADEPRDGVFAVPDVPEFGEADRERLLDLLSPVNRLRLTLIWRPIAALLGYIDDLDEADVFVPNDGMRVGVMSLVGSGIQLADAKLVRESWNGNDIWVPEREQVGLSVAGRCAGVSLALEVAQSVCEQLGTDAASVAKSLNAPWLRCVGEKPSFELYRKPNRSWQKPPEFPRPEISLSAGDFPKTFVDRLLQSDALIVEGPMVNNTAWVEAILEAVSWPADRPAHKAARGLVAKGCLAAAQRYRAGAPVYFDFLPQLEINALVDDEAQFVELIPKNHRLLGGTVYRAQAPGEYAISRGATSLTFYLFKEDFSEGRKAEIDLPEKADAQHRIRINVEQIPGQGFARVRIDSATFEPLRNQSMELDWSRMTPIDETREEILASLQGATGLAYPDTYTPPGHALHWHPDHRGGDLSTLLRAYLDRPLYVDGAIKADAFDILKKLRSRFSRPENPSFVAKSMGIDCDDQGSYRPLGGDGSLPSPARDLPVHPDADGLLDSVLEKVGVEFEQLLFHEGDAADVKLISEIVGFATWCFWRCPNSITEFLIDLYEGSSKFRLHHILLREGVGRAVNLNYELERYFSAVDGRLRSDGALTTAEFSALGRVLGGCPEGAGLLPRKAADRILQDTADQLADENRKPRSGAYKRKFKAALLMLAALLRHRCERPSFLEPEDRAAKELLSLLEEAVHRNRQFAVTEERAANSSRGITRARHNAAARRLNRNVEILSELIDQIHMEGSDPNIIRKIDELDDDDNDGNDDC